MDTVESEGLRSRKPDYLFRVNNFSRFIVEPVAYATGYTTSPLRGCSIAIHSRGGSRTKSMSRR